MQAAEHRNKACTLQFLYFITTCKKACKSFYLLRPREESHIFSCHAVTNLRTLPQLVLSCQVYKISSGNNVCWVLLYKNLFSKLDFASIDLENQRFTNQVLFVRLFQLGSVKFGKVDSFLYSLVLFSWVVLGSDFLATGYRMLR